MCDILIIEDQIIEANLLIQQLVQLKNEYISDNKIISSKQELLELIDNGEKFKIVLCDYKLALNFTAEDVISILYQRNIDVPIIIVTGAIGEEKAADLMRIGATDLVLKTNIQKLNQVINREIKTVYYKLGQIKIISTMNIILFKLAKLVNWIMQNSLNDISFKRILKDFSLLLETDRAYLFKKEDGKYILEHLFCDISKCEHKECLITQNYNCFRNNNNEYAKFIIPYIEQNEIVCGQLSQFDNEIQEELNKYNIKSLIIVPVLNPEKEIWGFLGFDVCNFERVWTQLEINTIKMLAAVLGTVIYKLILKIKQDEIMNEQINLMRSARESIMIYLQKGEEYGQ